MIAHILCNHIVLLKLFFQRKYIDTPWCPICLSMLYTITLARKHAANAKKCMHLYHFNLPLLKSEQMREADGSATTNRKAKSIKGFKEDKAETQRTAKNIEGPQNFLWHPPMMPRKIHQDWDAMKTLASWASPPV